ncbi:GNAT family N-acetyltransferase [Clostridium transplantifaecale]|uniref:GNAT family N-acetyltransferase n=1 Tax=Clostridium transplantifaecale TaxID=2479838 RepID=UPI000F63437E|nr:GNAT family N-acetyltransferase [Clostridium transplantifaecale]
MMNILVKTERLCIEPQNIEEMNALYHSEKDSGMKQAYHEMIETMQSLPGREEWGSNWRITLSGGTQVGEIGFKGAPDAEGAVELGYGIGEEFRRNGYATEAVKGLSNWAFGQEGVECVTAQTEPDNKASQRVLQKSGFIRDGYGDEGPLFKKFKPDTL